MPHALALLLDIQGFAPLGLRGDPTAESVWLPTASDALIVLACFVSAAMVVASIGAVVRAKVLRRSGALFRRRERTTQAEAWYRASVERIRLLSDGVKRYGIFVLDLQGRVATWNAGAHRISGYDASAIIGRQCTAFYRPEDIASGQPERELRGASTKGRFEGEGWRLRQDGTRFWASVLIVPLRDSRGCLRGFVEVIGDIAERNAPVDRMEQATNAEFRGLLECMPAAVVIVDHAGRIVMVNSEAEKTFGYTRRELPGMEFAALFPERLRASALASRRGAARKSRVRTSENSSGICGLRKDGTVFPVEICLNPIKTEDGHTFITTIRDVTEQEKVETGPAARVRQLGSLVMLVQHAMTTSDPKVLAEEVAALVARSLDVELCGVFQALPAEGGLRLQAGVGWRDGLVGQAIEPGGLGSLAGFILLPEDAVRRADSASALRYDVAPLARDHGAVGGLGFVVEGADRPYGILAAYTKQPRTFSNDEAFFLQSLAALLGSNLGRIASEESLRTQASTDAPTGLHNVRHLREALPAIYARAVRDGSSLSIVMLDVDHFKPFNDSFGHLAGDDVLTQIGAILRRELRPYDLAVRYGGEEFALLLPDTAAAAAIAFAERMRHAIASHPWPLRPVTASFGLATAAAGAPGSSILLAQADAALYAAKRSGRDRVVHHDAPQRPAAMPAASSARPLLPLPDPLNARRNGIGYADQIMLGISGNGALAGASHPTVEGPNHNGLVTDLPTCSDLELSSPFEIDPAAVTEMPGSSGAGELMAIISALLRADRAERELERAREGIGRQLREQTAQIEQVCDATIEGWARALELRDFETEGHSRRVTELTVRVARRMGFDEPSLVHVRRGALLHDIGKVGVPDAILSKPGPLDETEWSVMRRHPELAYQMLAPIGFLKNALEIPYSHHERWDGTGYPRGLRGEEIPRAARIFAVADIYDALSHDRPYREAWPPERVKEHLRSLAGTHLEPDVIEEFLAVV